MKLFKLLNLGNKGVTLLEVVVGLIVLSLVGLMIAQTNYAVSKAESLTKKRSSAAELCMNLMEEMRHLGTAGNGDKTIEDADDGNTLNPDLSVQGGYYIGKWKKGGRFCRQINVFQVPGENQSRRVRVRVFDSYTKDLLAETIGFIRIFSEDPLPFQKINLFQLPSMSVYTGNATPLKLRRDYSIGSFQVSSYSYGRDSKYKPKKIFNDYKKNYTETPTDSAYLCGLDFWRSDMFNHIIRYPPEETEFAAKLMKFESPGPDVVENYNGTTGDSGYNFPQIPLRYLLNEMAAGNPRFRHSVLKTDGIFMILPAMRNYSDAAKNPGTQPWQRAVVHPERIGYPTGNAVKLRVYSYVTKPDAFDSTQTTTVTVHLLKSIPAVNISVDRMVGNDKTDDYHWETNYTGPDLSVVQKDTETIITLQNSPLRHPSNEKKPFQGICPQERLYGMEYIPCLVKKGAGWDFKNGKEDLGDDSGTATNNSARWVITIEGDPTFNGLLTVETHLGDHNGAHANPNLSTTYVWVGKPVPLTERFQLLGDPRHMPYADVKKDQGYNQFFTHLDDSVQYGDFTETHNGWEYSHGFPDKNKPVVQRLNFDFPRYMEIYRTALLNSNSAILVGDSSHRDWNATPLAFVPLNFGFLGFDGENPLKCPETAWVPTSSALKIISEITPATTNRLGATADHCNLRLVAKTDNSWFCLPWLGELYPDDYSDYWKTYGNLPTGNGNFYRALYSVFSSTFGYTDPRDFAFQAVGAGLATLVNGGLDGNSNFVYNPFDTQQTVTFTTLWREIEKIFGNYQGLNQDGSSSRVCLDESNVKRPPENTGVARTKVELVKNFITPSLPGSYPYVTGILRMWDPTKPERSGWVVFNGNDQTNLLQDELKIELNSIISAWTFLEMGSPKLPENIQAQPVPYVSFTSPAPSARINNPTTIKLEWETQWLRWDKSPYTSDYPIEFKPKNSDLTYTLLFSKDNRATWVDIQKGIASEKLIRPWSQKLSSPYSWNVASLPEGRYVLRVEAFRGENFQGSAYHERRIEITRK